MSVSVSWSVVWDNGVDGVEDIGLGVLGVEVVGLEGVGVDFKGVEGVDIWVVGVEAGCGAGVDGFWVVVAGKVAGVAGIRAGVVGLGLVGLGSVVLGSEGLGSEGLGSEGLGSGFEGVWVGVGGSTDIGLRTRLSFLGGEGDWRRVNLLERVRGVGGGVNFLFCTASEKVRAGRGGVPQI